MAIDEATVDHWAKVIARGGHDSSSAAEAQRPPRQQALDFLISSDWLMGEAADRGLVVSTAAIRHQLEELRESVPDGGAAFQEALHSTGKTVADVKREIETELAATAIHGSLMRSAAPIAHTQVVDYYRSNLQRFRVPERRDVDLIENIKTPAAARSLARRVGSGASFASMALHEPVERPSSFDIHNWKGALAQAIFAARPGTIGGPLKLIHGYALFVVRRVTPGTFAPLADVQGTIAGELATERRRRALEEFVRAYRGKWLARTDCRAGFVVQKCSHYRGTMAPEESVFASG